MKIKRKRKKNINNIKKTIIIFHGENYKNNFFNYFFNIILILI